MTSYLQHAPLTVLIHIATHSGSSFVLEPPTDVLHLSLSNHYFYSALSVQSCPQLYANLFYARFDTTAVLRRLRSVHMLTSSALCAEFVQRYRAMLRIRRRDMSDQNMAQDLFTILMMVYESDGLNETQLTAAGLPQYILKLLRTRLSHSCANEIDHLVIWLSWLTLSRQAISRQGVREREELLDLLRPFAVSGLRCSRLVFSRSSSTHPSSPGPRGDRYTAIASGELVISGRPNNSNILYFKGSLMPAWLNASRASVLLTFALHAAGTFQIPPHVPLTRAIADETNRTGPTAEDYHAMANSRTLLIADTPPSVEACVIDDSRSMVHDQDFSRMAQYLDPIGQVFRLDIPAYVPGTLGGLWEGTWMQASPCDPTSQITTPSFLCRQPMQCCLREFLCFSPHVPLPTGDQSVTEEEVPSITWNINPHQLTKTDEGFDLDAPRCSGTYCYEEMDRSESSSDTSTVRRDYQNALDIVVKGETLRSHEKAWGPYNFAGRIRLQDGLIVLKREPKSEGDGGMGTWYFEGYIHSGAFLAGKWYSSDRSVEGIFSMTKKEEEMGY